MKAFALLLMALVVVFALACASEPTPLTPTDAPLAEEATPTVAPGATPTPTPTPFPTPTPVPTDTPVPTSTPEPTLTPTATAVPTFTPSPTPTPPTPEPTTTPAPNPTHAPTATPEPTTTPEPTATLVPTATPSPTATPAPSPTPTPSVNPALAGYSPLLAEAASNLPSKYDFVSDGLSAEERDILDWADSRLFSNPAFQASKWGPDRWPVEVQGAFVASTSSVGGRVLSDEEVRVASAQAVIALMREIDIEKRADGHHVVSWGLDRLDRVLDDLGVYPGMCVHCYGKTGYDTREGLNENYGVILEQGHVQREMLKHFAYFAKADGEGILVRGFMDNNADEFELLYKRRMNRFPTVIGTGSFAYEHVSFMSQIRLPEAMPELGLPAGALVSYPTMAFGMVGNVDGERESVEQVYDYMRKGLWHVTGDHEALANWFRPHSATPYSPELGWIVYVGEAGSGSAAGTVTGALRALGFKAEQFTTGALNVNAGSVEADGVWYYYNGNDPMALIVVDGIVKPHPNLCDFFRTLEQVENQEYESTCEDYK